jgi:hypothetical protein
MAKVTLSRLFEVSRYLSTESGKELKDALVYLSEFVEVVTRNLRNGLTFVDNFDSQIKSVSVKTGTESVILTEERRRVKEVVLRRVIDDTFYIVSAYGWKYNPEGNVVIQADFLDKDGNAPPATLDVNLALLIHFG